MTRTRIPRRLSAFAIALLAALPIAQSSSGLQEQTGPARRVRALRADGAGVPLPQHVVWLPDAGEFLLLQGEAAARVPHEGDPAALAAFRAGDGNVEAAWDSLSGRLVVLDALHRRMARLRPGETPIEAGNARWIDLPGLPAVRPAGLTVDPGSGALWILDAAGRRVIRVEPDRLAAGEEAAMRRARVGVIALDVPAGAPLQGLAFDPGDELLYTARGDTGQLLALDSAGRVVRTHDLSAAGISRPGRMVFAPSGDRTDDPEARSLYVIDGPDGARLHGHLVEVSLLATPAPPSVTTVTSSLVRTIDTSQWSPPSPDPSGLAYDAARNRLLVVDGEVEEMSIWRNANYFESSLTGGLLATGDLTSFSIEPVGVAWVPSGLQQLVSDDDARRVFVITLGGDGRPGTADDTVTSFSTNAFGSGDPEGVTLDAAGNRLFIADGVNAEVYEVRAGANGRFDGVAPGGDDQVTHFDTSSLGISDPETVEYDSVAGTLYIIGGDGNAVLEMTASGTALRSIDTSSVDFDHPAGLVLAPASADPSKRNLYICDRKVDNDSNSSENDGKIYEIAIGGSGGTEPPPDGVRVSASADDAEEKPTGSVSLSSSDLELVFDGAVQTVGMRFAGIDVPAGARISAAWIQFEADEAQSEATSLTLRGQASGNALAFTTAGFNVSSRPRTAASVDWSPVPWNGAGAAGPDQRTPDLSRIVEEIVGLPGWAPGNAMAFIVTGSGHRTAEAYDGRPAGAPLLHIEVGGGGGPVNQAPIVNAGPDQTVTFPDGAVLQGTVTDDDLPSPPGSTTSSWSTVSGPGQAVFDDPASPGTTVDFPSPGTYVLRLSASDSALSSSDTLSVTVLDPNAPIVFERRVAAGSDDAEQKATGSVSLTSSDLELVMDSSLQTVGIRFVDVGVPAGVTIERAWVQFKADEAQSEPTDLTIEAQASANPAGFATVKFSISTRPTLPEVVSWPALAAWTANQAGEAQKTPDLTSLIQQVIDQPGWASGNAVVLIIKGSGHRTAEAFEGQAAAAPLLHVEYR